jgi:hypothetical protein
MKRLEALEARAERLEDGFVMRPVVSAGAFVLVGPDGAPRMQAGPMPDGGTMLNQLDREGRTRTIMQVDGAGTPRFGFVDSNGTTRLSFYLDGQECPALQLRDANGKVRISIGIAPDGDPAVLLIDGRGQPRAVLSMAEDGSAGLFLLDEYGKPIKG